MSKMRYCKRCDAKYFKPDLRKCDICGGNLIDGENAYPNKVLVKFRNIPPVSGKLLAIVIVSVISIYITSMFFGFSVGAATGKNCHELEEFYFGEVPHEVDAVYVYYPKYRVLLSSLKQQWSDEMGFYYNYTVVLENADNDDYYYTIQYVLDTTNHGRLSSLVKKLVRSRENETFDAYFDTDLKENADGKFVVYPESIQKIGKAVQMENTTLSRKITRCF